MGSLARPAHTCEHCHHHHHHHRGTAVQPPDVTMPCFQRCCCCVNLRTGGLMMGFMTLVMSIFSIVPMAISLSNRLYLSRVVVYMLRRYGNANNEDEDYDDSDSEPFEAMEFWGTVNDVLKG